MKKISSVLLILVCSFVDVLGQVDFDRPEGFLFERKNRLVRINDSTQVDLDTVRIKNKLFAVEKAVQHTGYFSAYGSGYINSTAITNSFLKSYVYEKTFIDNDAKQQQVDRFKKRNAIGADLQVGLYGQYKVKNYFIEAGLGYRTFNSSQFSADAFNLVFYGNAMYAGQTASLSPLYINNVNYQKMYLGFKKNLGQKQNMQFGARLGIVRGGKLQKVKSQNLSLFTAADGSYLSLNGKFDVAFTDDTTYAAVPKMHGLGLSTDFFFSIKGKRSEFAIELLDVGFIHWNDVVTYSGDGSYIYSGVQVDNILTRSGLTLDPINLENLLGGVGISKKVEDVTYWLPSTLHVSYFRHISSKITLSGGVRQQFVHGYKPKVYGKLAYYLNKQFVLIPKVSYGGFGRADVELGIAKSFSKQLLISTNLFWFEFLALPEKTSGHGMSVALSYYF